MIASGDFLESFQTASQWGGIQAEASGLFEIEPGVCGGGVVKVGSVSKGNYYRGESGKENITES